MRSPLRRLLSRSLLGLCLVAGLASAQRGEIFYVARESIEDADLRAELAQIGGADAERFVLVLSEDPEQPGATRVLAPRSRASADDVELGRAIEAAEVLVLRGGTFLDWYETVYPRGGRTQLARSLRRFLQTKRPLVAYGGACAFLSGGVSVPTAELDEIERNPRRRREEYTERVAWGVGPRALFDCHEWEGGEPIRLLKALHRTRVDLGLFPVGDVALRYTREGRTLEVLGPGRVLALDLSRAKRSRGRVDRARIHLWTRGDTWSFGFARVGPAEGKELRARAGSSLRELVRGGLNRRATARFLTDSMLQLAVGEQDEVAEPLGDAHWTLRWDVASRRFGAPPEESILDVELSLRWSPR